MQQFRNILKGWVGKLLLVIFILPFAFFGIQGIILNAGKSNYALKVNGVEISKAEVDRAINAQRDAMVQRMGGKIDPSFFTDEMLRPRVIQMLVQKQLLAQAVKDEGLFVSGDSIKQYVRNMPQFKDEKGEFSQQKLEMLLARAGYTMTKFFDELSTGMVADQLQQGIGTSAFVTGPELKALIQLDGQKRDLTYTSLKLAPFLEKAEAGDDAVAKYFEENKAQYRTQEKVKIRYLTFKADDFAKDVSVSDNDLVAEYDSYVKSIDDQERRRASHILVEVNDKRDDADAKARIEEVKAKLDAGEDFAKVAKTYSDDTASAENGGDLDYAGRGIYDPAFEKTLFALKEGQVSGIVKSEFGYHIIKLTGIEKPKVESFDAKKDELRTKLAKSKAADKLNDVIDDLNKMTYESGDLTAIAEKYGKTIQEVGPFTRGGGNGIAADKKVIDAAFSDPLLKDGVNSDAIELADGSVVVLRDVDHEPARDQTLDEVKPQVVAAVKDQAARVKAKETAEAIVKKLKEGATEDAVAAEFNVTWEKKAGVTRQESKLSRTLVTKLFELPKPAEGAVVADKVSLPSGDQEILVLTKVEPGAFDMKGEELLKAQLGAGNRMGQLAFDSYLGTLKQNADIVEK